MKHAYYNEHDPYAAQWLRTLIDAGHIAPGDVDERSITDVRADDVRGYSQCHFFAGIGGWSIALRLAGWPDARPVWTGSCPCQPFSAAGAGKAGNDERHLWPAWFPLIAECKPAIVFGEQVEAAVGWGWLDVVFADLEKEGYACGATVLPACGVGAPHIRQRLWFVGHASGHDMGRLGGSTLGSQAESSRGGQVNGTGGVVLGSASATRSVADAGHGPGRERGDLQGASRAHEGAAPDQGRDGIERAASHSGTARELANSDSARCGPGRPGEAGDGRDTPWVELAGLRAAGGFWSDAEWIACTDGKARPTQPGVFPLGHGIQRRASKLRAYGNSIVPQIAAEFIAAAKGCLS